MPSQLHVAKYQDHKSMRHLFHNVNGILLDISCNKNLIVKNISLTIYNIDAVVFMLQERMPEVETLKQWKKHKVKIILICAGQDLSVKLSENLGSLADEILTLPEGHQEPESGEFPVLKNTTEKNKLDPKTTVFISDESSFIRQSKGLGFASYIGLSNHEAKRKLFYEKGARIVLHGAENIKVSEDLEEKVHFSQYIPDLFTAREKFAGALEDKIPVFFFAYDGTLTPIINDPDKAYIGDHTRSLLDDLARTYTVAAVSGRDMMDIKQFIKLDNLIYAGSHGFRISGPNDLYMIHEKAVELLPHLDAMEQELKDTVEKEIPGTYVERKHFAIAIHYRNAPPKSYRQVVQVANNLIAGDKKFKKGRGKKILEIKPALDWHKGKAIEWIMNKLEYSYPDKYVPLYVGDDITDEDGFRALSDDGIGILVGKHSQLSAAQYHLKDVNHVDEFLDYLVNSPEFK